MSTKSKSAGGAASKRARGLKQIVVGLTSDEREYLKAVAAQAGLSMADFVLRAALETARRVVPESRWKKDREKSEKVLTSLTSQTIL